MRNADLVQVGDPISGVFVPMLTTNLEIGSSGPEVDILNTFLIQKGFLGGGDYKGFGSSTYIAVQGFQVSQGIAPANGIVGPLTRAIINPLLSEINLPPAPTSLMRDLEIGSSGQDVFILEKFLKEKGFLLQEPTQYYSSSTYIAVQAFQVAQNITPANGFVRSLTRVIINEMLTNSTSTATTTNPTPVISTCTQTVTIDGHIFRLETCSYRDTVSVKNGAKHMPVTIIPSDPKVSFGYTIENVGFIPNSILGSSNGRGNGTTTIKKIFRPGTLLTSGKNARIYSGQFKVRIFLTKKPSGNNYLYQNVNVTVKP
jgi:peptidoglycan hydrolase-like protein with peptidoglycan-binding domain